MAKKTSDLEAPSEGVFIENGVCTKVTGIKGENARLTFEEVIKRLIFNDSMRLNEKGE